MARKKVLPPTYFNLALLLSLILHFLIPIDKIIRFPWNLLGLIPALIGVVLNLHADRSFKQFSTTVKPFQESTALIQNGTFSFTRNPMYLGMTLILLGLSIFLGSISPYVIVIFYIILMDRIFIRVEEHMLADTFESEWLEYKKKTRRWI